MAAKIPAATKIIDVIIIEFSCIDEFCSLKDSEIMERVPDS